MSKIIVKYDGKSIILPQKIQKDIDEYWNKLLKSGKEYFNGEVYAISNMHFDNGELASIYLSKTNYSHFLYAKSPGVNLGDYDVRIVFSAGAVITSDDKIVLGKMGKHTARSGKLQFAGGGIDDNDLCKDNSFDIFGSMKREVSEEIGLDIDDISRVDKVELCCVGQSRNIAFVYRIDLKETFEEFKIKYDSFVQELDDKPEFDEILAISKTKEEIDKFMNNNSENLAYYMNFILPYFKDN